MGLILYHAVKEIDRSIRSRVFHWNRTLFVGEIWHMKHFTARLEQLQLLQKTGADLKSSIPLVVRPIRASEGNTYRRATPISCS